MNPTEVQSRLDLALSAGRQAAKITLRYFRRDDLAVERKADQSPVTVADREAEQFLRGAIRAAFPDDGVLGEEFGETEGNSGYRWILDPIDGTKSFIHGVPLYSTLIGVEHAGRCVAGVILIPALDELVYAASGGGAWYCRGSRDAEPARVSQTARLDESLFLNSEVKSFAALERLDTYLKLDEACRLGRTWGDGYGYLLVATGRAEVMLDPAMNVWDAAPLQPILEEAGGTFTDWNGKPSIYSGEGIGTNGHVLDEVLQFTKAPEVRAAD